MEDPYVFWRAVATGAWIGMLSGAPGLDQPWAGAVIVFSLGGIIFTWLYKREFDTRPLYERRRKPLRK